MTKIYEIHCQREQKPLKSPENKEKPNYFTKFELNLVVLCRITVIDRRKVLKIAEKRRE